MNLRYYWQHWFGFKEGFFLDGRWFDHRSVRKKNKYKMLHAIENTACQTAENPLLFVVCYTHRAAISFSHRRK
jgi:hypothetical protein